MNCRTCRHMESSTVASGENQCVTCHHGSNFQPVSPLDVAVTRSAGPDMEFPELFADEDGLPVYGPAVDPLATQIGGDHYKDMPIQPMEFSLANGLDAAQHTVIKYVCRHGKKNGKEDLLKAQHCIDMMIARFYPD